MSPKSIEVGPLEMKVLGLLRGPEPQSVSDIQSLLKKSGDDLAYTTVMTVLSRLFEKGFVARQKEGRSFLYHVTEGKSSLTQRLFDKVHKSLFGSERLKPILALVESDNGLSHEDLEELKRAVDQRLKEAKQKP